MKSASIFCVGPLTLLLANAAIEAQLAERHPEGPLGPKNRWPEASAFTFKPEVPRWKPDHYRRTGSKYF